jgi:hypothetical protein
LTYSTPIFNGQIKSSAFAVYEATKQILSAQGTRKPRVNFHSIDDIVYGGSETVQDKVSHSFEFNNNDSGLSSFHSSKFGSFNSTPSMAQEASNNEGIDVESTSDNEDDKENQSESPKQLANTNSDGKKFRTSFTDDQKKALDVYFRKNPYPDPKETEDLSKQLVLPENVIKVWFQNKRSRDKQRKFSNRSSQKHINNDCSGFSTSSPIVANLQMLTSRLNSYAALAAFQNNAKFQNVQNFYN